MKAVRISLGIAALALGTVAILAGIAATGVVASILTLVGQTGTVSQDMGTVAGGPADSAVIIDGVEAAITVGALPSMVTDALATAGTSPEQLIRERGTFVLLATAPTAGDVFIGLSDPGPVDDYLYGHPYAVAELAPDRTWRTLSVPGMGTPQPPAEQAWTASAAGRPAQLPAASLSGQTLVLMRPDATAPAAADLRLEYRVPEAPSVLRSSAITAAASAAGGLLLILLGAWLVVGPRRRPQGKHA